MMAIGRSENPACGKHYALLGLVLAVDQRAVVSYLRHRVLSNSTPQPSAAVRIGRHAGCYGRREGIVVYFIWLKLQITHPKLCVSISVYIYIYWIVIPSQMHIGKEMQMVIYWNTLILQMNTLIYRISL